MSKTVLFLGAGHQQLAPIEYARSMDYRVITCDNRKDNPGHQLSDRSYDVSTTDLEAVLTLASRENVDAIIAYASDVSAYTAAWVSERMGLCGNPSESVLTLVRKDRFRNFQKAQGLYHPRFKVYQGSDLEDLVAVAKTITCELTFPMMVKPVDASGSRGVSKVKTLRDLPVGLALALRNSRSGVIIIEEFVPRVEFQICGEGFLVDGKISLCVFADEYFVEGLIPPVGEAFPSATSAKNKDRGVAVLQQIFSALEMKSGAFNFDLIYAEDGAVFVVEIGPRNGGNRMPEAIKYATGLDMISATVETALGKTISFKQKSDKACATYSIHSKIDGVFAGIDYKSEILPKIVNVLLFKKEGEKVSRFYNGGEMIGNVILEFDSQAEMRFTLEAMDHLVVPRIL